MMVVDIAETSNVQEKHVVFYDVSWDFYEAVQREYGGHPSRVSYHQGTLEIVNFSIEREAHKCILGEMIAEIAIEFNIPFAPRGSTTLKYQSRACGLEPDKCFWIQNEDLIRSVHDLDLTIHPAPDLVVE